MGISDVCVSAPLRILFEMGACVCVAVRMRRVSAFQHVRGVMELTVCRNY